VKLAITPPRQGQIFSLDVLVQSQERRESARSSSFCLKVNSAILRVIGQTVKENSATLRIAHFPQQSIG
jgi:uncharacterized protein YPO0396